MVKFRAIHAYLLVALAFLLGAASGGALTYGYVKHQQIELLEDDGRRISEVHRVRALERMLDLDEAQREKVRAIFRAAQASRREIEDDVLVRCGERLREHRKKIDDEIRAILRPDQRERFDRLMEKRHERRRPPKRDGAPRPAPSGVGHP